MKKTCKYNHMFCKFKYGFTDFLMQNKKIIFLMLFVMLLCVFTAIFTAIKSGSGLTLFNLADKVLSDFLKGKTSLIGLWFSRFIYYSFFIILIYVFSLSKWLFFADLIIIGYLSFMSAINATIVIIVFGVSSILFALILYFIINITIVFCLIILIVLLIKNGNKNCFKNKWFIWTLCIILLLITIQTILTPIFIAPIIVIV